ncbi:flavin reductase family protein [Alkalicoccus luteus]|uniref:flavin reductase family protein n=1 Tax=Alkalicoccus luteus TaxID=1237094 RepID=UPI004033B82D
MLKPVKKTVMHSYPGLVALVTTAFEGETNIMAAGWHSYISYDPPIYGVAVAEERHSHRLMKESGSFAVQFVSADHAAVIQKAGTYSGSEGNKLDKIGLSWQIGRTVPVPVLDCAYAAYECRIIDRNTYGDHDWFVADITQFHQDASCFQENGLPNMEVNPLPLYLGRSTYLTADEQTSRRNVHIRR